MHDLKNKPNSSLKSARSENDILRADIISKNDSHSNQSSNYKNINELYIKIPDYVIETKKRREKYLNFDKLNYMKMQKIEEEDK